MRRILHCKIHPLNNFEPKNQVVNMMKSTWKNKWRRLSEMSSRFDSRQINSIVSGWFGGAAFSKSGCECVRLLRDDATNNVKFLKPECQCSHKNETPQNETPW